MTFNRFDKIPISIQKKLALQVIQVMWFPFLSPPDRWNVWIVNFEFRLRPLLMFVQLRTISVGMHHFVLYLHFNCKFWIGISVIFLSISLRISDHHNHYYYQIIIISIIISWSSSSHLHSMKALSPKPLFSKSDHYQ